jgi:pyruvate formate lyase activating enzyme
MPEATFWEKTGTGQVRCTTCPNRCERGEGGVTACRTRVAKGGRLYTLTYGKPCLVCSDPLTKNPLYHVDPGASAVGAATAGCNLTCKYCQNFDISQNGPEKTRNMDLPPEQLVAKVSERKLRWLTFSYTEPTAYLEYAVAAARVARKNGIRVAMATAGYISEPALDELIKCTDAFSLTLKGYDAVFYRDVCGASLDTVWKSIDRIVAARTWMEVVTLVVPGMNDDLSRLKEQAGQLARRGRDIPLHYLRFAPAYKLRALEPTPVSTLEKARLGAMEAGLRFVYLDVSGHEGANTYCPNCRKKLIERAGFAVLENRLKGSRCPFCSATVAGLFPKATS